MSKEALGEATVPAFFPHRENSETAASASNRLYGPSGVISYRVRMQTAMGGLVHADVDAATGDEAAEKALEQFPGAKVAHIEPAPRKAA